MSSTDDTLERVELTGTLECRSPLHLGSGFDRPGGQGQGNISEVCRDAGGRPYLPAGSLRGFLAGVLERRGDPHLYRRILGTARLAEDARRPESERDRGQAGALRVYDARLASPAADVSGEQTRIALHPVTGTARAHHLFGEEVIRPGARFACRLELDRIGEAELDALLQALAALDGGPAATLGAGATHGRGRMRWETGRIAVLYRDAFRDWLRGDGPLEERFVERPSPATGERSDAPLLTVPLAILPTAPLLVSDPAAKRGDKNDPHRVYLAQDGCIRVPGSTLKGLLRGRCRRILVTMGTRLEKDAEFAVILRVADRLLGRLFGDTGRRGWLRVGDALGKAGDNVPHPQFFNAIDRFTGGVADGLLYKVLAVRARRLKTGIALDRRLFQSGRRWSLGLLALLLRDAMEGDLALGWGKARGYGAFRMAVVSEGGSWIKNWAVWRDDRGQARLEYEVGRLDVCLRRLVRVYGKVGEQGDGA